MAEVLWRSDGLGRVGLNVSVSVSVSLSVNSGSSKLSAKTRHGRMTSSVLSSSKIETVPGLRILRYEASEGTSTYDKVLVGVSG